MVHLPAGHRTLLARNLNAHVTLRSIPEFCNACTPTEQACLRIDLWHINTPSVSLFGCEHLQACH